MQTIHAGKIITKFNDSLQIEAKLKIKKKKKTGAMLCVVKYYNPNADVKDVKHYSNSFHLNGRT